MLRFLLRLLVSAVALWATAELLASDGPLLDADAGIVLSDDRFTGPWYGTLLLVAAIFGVVNAVLRPLIKLIGCGLYALTLGLVALVVNGALLLLTSWLAQEVFGLGFEVKGFLTAVLGALMISVVSWFLNIVVKSAKS